ncbi:hypothetical protein ACHAWF_009484 [Thalassiosira exigua]
MSPSTAATKSACLTLALLAWSSPGAAAASLPLEGSCGDCDVSAAVVMGRLPLHLSHLSHLSSDEEYEPAATNNASAFYSEGSHHDDEREEEEFQLPAELAAMIAESRRSEPSSHPASAPTLGGTRYYASYAEGESCSSKDASEFESWEESYGSREECCDVAFGWDYENCTRSGDVAEAERECELPAELAALIDAQNRRPSPSAAAASADATARRYYPTFSEGESCSSKPVERFEAWEESYATKEECCEAAFSWDYESCVDA